MTESIANRPLTFMEELHEQRWDDHRYYHQSRINQTLHLFSACCFLTTYVLIPMDPAAAALLGWIVAFWSRQLGHFFFEPKGYDDVNRVTFAHKEKIKVGYNLQRKVILGLVWISVPAFLWLAPRLGVGEPYASVNAYAHALGIAWFALAGIGLFARTLWLCLTRSVQTGLVWLAKILTDPFNDVRTYYKAPYYLFVKGELIDPMEHARAEADAQRAPSSQHA